MPRPGGVGPVGCWRSDESGRPGWSTRRRRAIPPAASTGPKAAEPGRVILNFEVEDANAAAARIDRLGGEWLALLEDRDGSWFATAIDPDGNYVQIIQLSEAAKAEMSRPSEGA